MAQFQEITLINYARPLRERLESRKVVGPYRWTPAKPGGTRGFYQASDERNSGSFHPIAPTKMDAYGSAFDLRLSYAETHLPRESRLRGIRGYYADSFQDDTLTPIVASLPHGRGFLAGWTMGPGMCGAIDLDTYDSAEDAARAAHEMAERDAQDMQEAEAGEHETDTDDGDWNPYSDPED